jgi:hypothetical protein
MSFTAFFLGNLLVVAFMCIITGVVGGICLPYAVNHWLIYAHKDPSVTFLKGFLVGLFPPFGVLSMWAALGTFIVSLLVG